MTTSNGGHTSKTSAEQAEVEVCFLDESEDDVDFSLPAFVSTTNTYELYGLREGETVLEAIVRGKQVKRS